MRRERSHEEALSDISEAAESDEVPIMAFAVFLHEHRSDFTHSVDPDCDSGERLSAIIEGLSSHAAATSEVTGIPLDELLAAVYRAAQPKREEGSQ